MLTEEEFERKVKDVVRLALCSELRRTPMRREDILKKVLVNHPKAYNQVMAAADTRLRDVFGMTIAELPTKERRNVIGSTAARRAAANKDRPTTTYVKSYMLKNVIPQEHRRSELINWRNDEPAMGLLMVILSLILVNGRVLTDDQLNHYFRRLYLTENHHEVFDNIGEVVNTFVKQGYLDKVKLASADTSRSSDKDHYEYYCGPRAKVEIKESNMIGFIQRIFGDVSLEKLSKQIERASGTEIRDE
ncbi:5161_t:CDS:2 [Paraglomus brasilianum]|uniref:5161_t:CDS:1 n=1 Tax=Paraglomus brasilianum TaxID=144538 RepID=A0A9N9DAW2_9GLOM|nr:5161_t:CDS:2 [Paraglomus brasilianum]